MRYAVAYVSFFDNDLELVVTDCTDPITAIHDAVEEMTEKSDWLDDLCRPVATQENWPEQIKKIKEEFFSCDALVSVLPV